MENVAGVVAPEGSNDFKRCSNDGAVEPTVYWCLYSENDYNEYYNSLDGSNPLKASLDANSSRMRFVGIERGDCTSHTMGVYYMERGAYQSNCFVSFNMPKASDYLALTKEVLPTEARGENDEFRFILYEISEADYVAYIKDRSLEYEVPHLQPLHL
jgi:hypothetical protein